MDKVSEQDCQVMAAYDALVAPNDLSMWVEPCTAAQQTAAVELLQSLGLDLPDDIEWV